MESLSLNSVKIRLADRPGIEYRSQEVGKWQWVQDKGSVVKSSLLETFYEFSEESGEFPLSPHQIGGKKCNRN